LLGIDQYEKKMDLYERRLKQLEADYSETIEVGERASRVRKSTSEIYEYHALSAEASNVPSCGVSQERIDTPTFYQTSRPVEENKTISPLTIEQIDKIKCDMSKIQLKHEPSWGKQVSDEKLTRMLISMIE
jgi:hypothetical protein